MSSWTHGAQAQTHEPVIRKVFALKKLVSKFKAHITTCAIASKTFIWLSFTGGMSAFAVILPTISARMLSQVGNSQREAVRSGLQRSVERGR